VRVEYGQRAVSRLPYLDRTLTTKRKGWTSLMRKIVTGGALASLMIAVSIAAAAPAAAAPAPSGCKTDIEAGTNGSRILGNCSHGQGFFWVEASCLRPDGSGLRFTAEGNVRVPGQYWSTYYPCKSPRNVRVETIQIVD
jgi:hypothetical protein